MSAEAPYADTDARPSVNGATGAWRSGVIWVLSLVYIVVVVGNFFMPLAPMAVIPIHVYLTVAIVLLAKPLGAGRQKLSKPDSVAASTPSSEDAPSTVSMWPGLIDGALALAALALCVHYLDASVRLQTRMQYVDPVELRDIVAFLAGTSLILEAIRRLVGWALLGLLLAFLLYAFFGNLLPYPVGFRGFTVDEITDILSMQTLGIFDIPAQVGLNVISIFVFFGIAFTITGGGRVFIDVAFLLMGRFTGGAAKSAVVASGLFGTVSGSAVANVSTTGVLTIPLMKRDGLTAEQAAATEAISSTGGQLMPPIMGTAVFVMAQILGQPYIKVAMAGLIPALGFYFALLVMLDLGARKRGKRAGEAAYQAAPIGPRVHLLLSPVVLVILLFSGFSAAYAALIATGIAFAAPLLRPATWYGPKKIASYVSAAGVQAAEIAVACASVGIIMAIAIQSTLVLKFVTALSSAGGDFLLPSLLLVIAGCIVMGMGMPTVAAYIVGAVLFVPVLTELGLPVLSAHYFVLYYCVLSMVTPPVALTAYAAAGIAGANIMKTSVLAFLYGLVIFVIPFGFIRDETLLLQGSVTETMLAIVGVLAATFAWAVVLQNWLGRMLSLVERAVFALLSFSIILVPTGTWIWFALLGTLLVLGTAPLVLKQMVSLPAKPAGPESEGPYDD